MRSGQLIFLRTHGEVADALRITITRSTNVCEVPIDKPYDGPFSEAACEGMQCADQPRGNAQRKGGNLGERPTDSRLSGRR